ncbi:diguanylate cyclase [Aurantimonas sp. VKM B-3413]|uniref:GGDEF domain-containing protein n=1 Tax=Aurantimonas sp. VKM B-3413 TaxID=2779401 RepID=UPI001E4AE84B|nr:GGDEF domain-containing protein [Aurantimonas sp. VKM B-3413]MCB8838975.1 GGDEF domain-containing protein [Aurantimonas sp. VKM B-3413]
MIRRWLNVLRGVDRFLGLLLLATCALAVLAVVTSVQIQRKQTRLVEMTSYDLTYSYTRTQIEVLLLQGAIRDALLKERDATSPKLRLAIVQSRVSTIPDKIGGIEFPEALAARDRLEATLASVAPLVNSLATPNHGAEALRLLDETVREFTQLSALANVRQAKLAEKDMDILVVTMAWLSANLLLLCLIGVALLTLIFRQKRRLRQIAVTDALTGLPNRAAIQNWKPDRGRPVEVALALIDIDRFKSVNDEFGHAVGDELLRILASVLRLHARGASLSARLGGDEFVVLFTGEGAETAARADCGAIAEAFRDRARKEGIARVSLSIGIAARRAASAADLAALMIEADQAMYAAKQDGGDGQSVARGDPVRNAVQPAPIESEPEPALAQAGLRVAG